MVLAWMGAPWSSRISEILTCPFRAAQWSGVNSSFIRQWKPESSEGGHPWLCGTSLSTVLFPGVECLRLPSDLLGFSSVLTVSCCSQLQTTHSVRQQGTSLIESLQPGETQRQTSPPALALKAAGTYLGPGFYLSPSVQQESHHDHVPPAGGDVQWSDAILETEIGENQKQFFFGRAHTSDSLAPAPPPAAAEQAATLTKGGPHLRESWGLCGSDGSAAKHSKLTKPTLYVEQSSPASCVHLLSGHMEL